MDCQIIPPARDRLVVYYYYLYYQRKDLASAKSPDQFHAKI